VLLQTIYLSIDPVMRSWMNEGTAYQQGVPLGEVMRGVGQIAVQIARIEGCRVVTVFGNCLADQVSISSE
jgi:NADPH-dependent curcumin reductase CurA